MHLEVFSGFSNLILWQLSLLISVDFMSLKIHLLESLLEQNGIFHNVFGVGELLLHDINVVGLPLHQQVFELELPQGFFSKGLVFALYAPNLM